MPLVKFRDDGYLQEVNRRFFHPLGLAMAVEVDDVTKEPNGRFKIWDGRDDPEGFVFEDWTDRDRARGESIEQALQQSLAFREEHIGFGIQPLSGPGR